jgi:hypothetical protein
MLRLRFQHTCCVVAVHISLLATSAWAQDVNVLGLPAIPQPKPGSPAAAAANAASAKSVTPMPANRDILAGELGIQHSALEGLGRIVITTRSTFPTPAAASNAIQVARTVQREIAQACGKQCTPQKMAAPKILSSGQLEFDLAFRPLYQHLNQSQFVAAVQGKPLNLTPAQLAAPSAAAPAVTASATASAAAAPGATPASSNTTATR